ncbi:MAG: methionine--tRNA ligase, partial [Treponema sp.]|nr:methionine--tRNA ligase [Treponema sp.]
GKIAGFFTGDDGGALSWKDIGKPEGVERVVKSAVLFEKLEEGRMAELREKYSGSQTERAPAAQDAASRDTAANGAGEKGASVTKDDKDDIEKRFSETVDLRVAKIVKIEKHPKADKLYIETLDITGEERVIVSGLVPFYKEEELLNRHIIVVYNLKPAKLRGVESRGMLLAASCKTADGEIVEVLDGKSAAAGSRAHLEGMPPAAAPPELDIDAFSSMPITVRQNTVYIGGKALCLDGKPVRTERVENGEAH